MSEPAPSGMAEKFLRLSWKIFAAVVLLYLAVEIAKTLWVPVMIVTVVVSILTLSIWWYRAKRAF